MVDVSTWVATRL
uniref:Uncharacterized protein n=1 Tax=Rhizophora mucronata TaxID=61149 RepID=A0A2P2MXG9_RHIMU